MNLKKPLLQTDVMKKIVLVSCIVLLFSSAGLSQKSDFVPLFNGRDLTNWVLAAPEGFEVVLGEMITRSYGPGTDIFSAKSYGNFILRLDFLLSEVGNSGVFIWRNPAIQSNGFEVQLLAPWTPWRPDLYCTGSLYGHVAVSNRPEETPGIWYSMEITCDRELVTVSVNGEITTIADIDTVKTLAGKPNTGLIGLQGNHGIKGQYAKFRNIYIRDLDEEPDYVLKGFYDKNDQRRKLARIAAVNLGAEMIQPLAGLLSSDNTAARSGARQALFDIVARASDPARPENSRAGVRFALNQSIQASSTETTVNYLEWLAGLISE
jgi:hypothetical protein